MTIKIQLGPGNSIEKNISHTDEIQDSWIEFLGGDPDNSEFVVDGLPYEGPLADGTLVSVRQKTNSKGI